MTKSVLIADDHPLFRRGLRTLLENQSEYRLIGEAENGLEAMDLIERLAPELLVLDLDMPELDGFGVLERLRGHPKAPCVALLTIHNDEVYLARATELGAQGYILKENAEEDLLECLDRIVSGGHFTTPGLMCRDDAQDVAREIDNLTAAERRILQLLPECETNQEIADRLDVSRRTVENHRARVVEKLALRGPNALLRFVLEHRSLIDLTTK